MELENKFEQAQAMLGSPRAFLAQISRDGRYAGNKRIMALIKEILDGFRRYAGYAVLSGLKGLNPFRRDAEMVDMGYYDFKKTPEYKQAMGRLAAELGISGAYFQEETLGKYGALRGYVAERFGAGSGELAEMELTGKGLFSFRADGTSFLVDVVGEDTCRRFGEFLAEGRDYRGFRLEEIASGPFQGYWFMDAGSEVYKAFLAQGQDIGHGRETGRPENVEQEPYSGESGEKRKLKEDGKKPQPETEARLETRPETGEGGQGERLAKTEKEKRLISMGEFVFERDGGSVILKRYRGEKSVVAVPSVIEAEGREFPVSGIWEKAFWGTATEHVWVDAKKIRLEEWNPLAVRSGGNAFLQVHWRNLSPQMERTLKENRRWAEMELRNPSMFKDLMEGLDAVQESPHKKHPFFSRWREKRAAERQAAGRDGERIRRGRETLPRDEPDAGRPAGKAPARRKKSRGMDI